MTQIRWAEVDVVLADGGVAHLRLIRPDDGERLVAFHARLSPESRYFRFFNYHPQLSEREVERFTHVDSDRRFAIVAELNSELIAVGRYDADDEGGAEVAFAVQDGYQGLGIGSLLLEHLADAARHRGITRFYADTLGTNQRMQRVFHETGYQVSTRYESGVVRVEFPILQTPDSLAADEVRRLR